jgi:S1-C subfamily serine protease
LAVLGGGTGAILLNDTPGGTGVYYSNTLSVTNDNILVDADIIPALDNVYNIGGETACYDNMFTSNVTIKNDGPTAAILGSTAGQLTVNGSPILTDSQVDLVSNSRQIYENSIDSVVVIVIRDSAGDFYVGSGFFIEGPSSAFGYVATAAHVIGDPSITGNPIAPEIWVHTTHPFNDIFSVSPTDDVIGYDKIADVALLAIPGSTYKPLQFKDSRSELKIGETVSVIGYPSAFDIQSVARGIVRDNKSQNTGNVIESVMTDASIFGGNSGGPIITDDNKVVAITSWGINGAEGLNGGVGTSLAKPILDYFLANYTGSVIDFPKGYLGIEYTALSVALAINLGVPVVEGYYVTGLDGTITPKFDIGDVIVEVAGTKVGIMNDQFSLFTEVHLIPPATSIQVKYRPAATPTSVLVKNITTDPFNPARDVFLNNYHREPVDMSKF